MVSSPYNRPHSIALQIFRLIVETGIDLEFENEGVFHLVSGKVGQVSLRPAAPPLESGIEQP